MAKSADLRLTVITPERQVLAESAESVTLPAHDGELGILPRRAPIVCELGIGELRYRRGNQVERLMIDGGFAQVLDDNVTVLTDAALRPSEVGEHAVAAARRTFEALPETATPEQRQRARQRWVVLQRMVAG